MYFIVESVVIFAIGYLPAMALKVSVDVPFQIITGGGNFYGNGQSKRVLLMRKR